MVVAIFRVDFGSILRSAFGARLFHSALGARSFQVAFGAVMLLLLRR